MAGGHPPLRVRSPRAAVPSVTARLRDGRIFAWTKSAPIKSAISGISVSTTSHEPITAVRLLSRRELADRWSMSVETLKRRERCGILPFLKLGRGVRYRLSDIEQIEAEAEVRRSSALAA